MPRAAVAAGALALALVAACAAFAWPGASPVAAQPGGEIEGDAGWAWAFLACAAGALIAYVAGVVLLGRRASGLRAVVALGVALQLAPLAAPLLLSTDAWTYWDYGRIAAVHDGNPYRHVPADFSADPAFPFVGAAWRDSTSVYGPAFTLASEPLALASGESADAAGWLYKALAAAAILGAAALALRLAANRSRAFALVAWNPVLALHLAGGGHNDAWIALLMTAALALGTAGRSAGEGAAWASAALVKWVPLVLVPLRAVEVGVRGGRLARAAAGAVAAGAALAALALWRYGTAWLEAAAPLLRNARTETEYAIPHRLTQLGTPRWLALALAATAFALAYAWLLRDAVRGRARLGVAMAALLLTTPYLAPWYLAWLVPVAAVDEDLLARRLTFLLSAYLLPQTIPVCSEALSRAVRSLPGVARRG